MPALWRESPQARYPQTPGDKARGKEVVPGLAILLYRMREDLYPITVLSASLQALCGRGDRRGAAPLV